MAAVGTAQERPAGRERRARRERAWLGAVAGLASGLVTVGTAALVAIVTGTSSDPLVAVGAAFVDATPTWLKEFAAEAFGTADKVALGVGEALVLAGLAALAGVLAARRWVWGAAVVVVLGLVAAGAALGRPGASVAAALPAVVGTAVGLWTLRALVGRLPGPERVGSAHAEPGGDPAAGQLVRGVDWAGVDRRGFLRAVGVAGALGAVGIVVGRAAGAAGRAVTAARDAIRLPRPGRAAAPVPADVDVGVDGVGPWATPTDAFYRIDTALVVPQVDPATWTLRVHGLVGREVELTWEELLASDLVEAWVTLCCVSNPVGGDLVGNQRWLGLPVREVLARAVPDADADMVLSRSADGWTASTPIEALTDDRDALLAVGMDGAPLPVEHGFPVRLVVPGLYGYVSATKWVTELEVTRFADTRAYWTQRGWAPRGPVKTQSRIEVPRGGGDVEAGDVVVAGTAWAQHRGVTRVQVRADEGAWQDATLAADGGIDSWRQWRWTWRAEPGEHVLHVRAFDPDGPQTGAAAGVLPDGATGYDSVHVTVR
ncbi:molybdopterin-dependent oxidoreductase [Cellulomonas palmilytica]|uniref:molybdopterin-dependent oxidoreductase n=1 Tax=Cellulomonas palmilytica TaxID=2608402 RepID=UPI001F3DCF12|nr:molybdopterin-dependent oxidoreductase [Cellulomonas palmilytica]UJP39595.1 molybdopterin-dependent oxidoreductase [Cellulomonas palmilytica]